ncbi:MAG: diguanylate cyclase [Acidobacteria bacterium]|nr:diguanylate cyclase [Acidobacteriota bacterium]
MSPRGKQSLPEALALVLAARIQDPEVLGAVSQIAADEKWIFVPLREAIDVDEYPWDALIVDARKSPEDAMELCASIKDDPHRRDRYVIVAAAAEDVERRVKSLDRGADDVVSIPIRERELVSRLRIAARAIELRRTLLLTNTRLERLASSDALTQLHNHATIHSLLAGTFSIVKEARGRVSIALVDIDHFKRINDTLGHLAGDRVIETLSTVLANAVGTRDSVARFGGEEFAVLMPDSTVDDAVSTAHTIRAAIEAHFRDQPELPDVTVSIGVANYPQTAFTSAEEMFDAADMALYRAKDAGRNTIRVERRTSPREKHLVIATRKRRRERQLGIPPKVEKIVDYDGDDTISSRAGLPSFLRETDDESDRIEN